MILLIVFAFLAGIVTVLSPCILPILPIVLSGSISGGKRKPLGIITGFIVSFTFFTLFLSTIVKITGLSGDFLRVLSIIIIFSFGLGLLVPKFQTILETVFVRLAKLVPSAGNKTGYTGGVIIGMSLGLLWTPCVGPILAAVISLALTGVVNGTTFLITFSYALGTAIPMFLITYGGRQLLTRVPGLLQNTSKIQKVFGAVMVLTAIAIFFNIDRQFQTFILEKFPSYGVGLTKFEDNPLVRKTLNSVTTSKLDESAIGKPMGDILENNIGTAPELILGGKWFNLPSGEKSLSLKNLRGKVVLVDFWTYTCINCIRTLPYIRDWNEKYKDKGLVIIGVHTPEFEFEKNAENVEKAIKDFHLTYPILQDNNYQTWNAYDNHYWPAKYLIDAKGKIRDHHFGEGDYKETEEKIQALLQEAGATVSTPVSDMPDETPHSQMSPETYLGASRVEFYYPDRRLSPGTKTYSLAKDIPDNTFTVGGIWNVESEFATSGKNAILEYNFLAKKVFLVMRPEKEGSPLFVKVYIDGKLADNTNSGEDVREGIVTIDSDRLYTLVNLKDGSANHILRLEFSEGIDVFAFTFG